MLFFVHEYQRVLNFWLNLIEPPKYQASQRDLARIDLQLYMTRKYGTPAHNGVDFQYE